MTIPDFKSAKEQVLVGLYRLITGEEGVDWIHAEGLAAEANLTMPIAYLRKVLSSLVAEELVEESPRVAGRIVTYSIAEEGILLVQQRLLAGAELASNDVPESSLIPASDRFVTRADNQTAADQAVTALTELETEITKSNEFASQFGELKEAALGELRALKLVLQQAAIRVEPALNLAKRTLGWIASKASSAAIVDLAKRALQIILDWLF